MRYFFIKQDAKLVHGPQIVNWYQKINVEDIQPGTYYKIPNRVVLPVRGDKDTIFPEVLFHPFFMISKKIKDVLKLYEPALKYKEIVLLDGQNNKAEVYFLPFLEEIDCIVKEKTVYGQFHASIEKGAISKAAVGENSIFFIRHNNDKYIIVRLDLLESMLRRDAILRIEELETV